MYEELVQLIELAGKRAIDAGIPSDAVTTLIRDIGPILKRLDDGETGRLIEDLKAIIE